MEAVIGVAGLAVGAVGAIDLCLKYGKQLNDMCKTFRHADTELGERVIYVRSQWQRTSMQLDFMNQIWSALDVEHQAIQREILQVLAVKLDTAISKLKNLYKPGKDSSEVAREKKLKLVFTKNTLDRIIQDLMKWQQMFDPSWFLTMRLANPIIDEELKKRKDDGNMDLVHASTFRYAAGTGNHNKPTEAISIFLKADILQSTVVEPIRYSSEMYIRSPGSEVCYVMESFVFDARADIKLVTRDATALARKLSTGDPHTLGLLQCYGIVRKSNDTDNTLSFMMMFKVPGDFTSPPESLRSKLVTETKHNLTERFDLAKRLARSVSYIHSLEFVHKDIRPETITAFDTDDKTLGSFFLTGFQMIRMADGLTSRIGDTTWEKNLYRHPKRQGIRPEDSYVMQHDIYSLGVCLLEIGLWSSFVSYDQQERATPSYTPKLSPDNPEFQNAILMKKHLIALAKTQLPMLMGNVYTDTVVDCLTCLDLENAAFQDENDFEDEDDILIGLRYIEKVHLRLESIVI